MERVIIEIRQKNGGWIEYAKPKLPKGDREARAALESSMRKKLKPLGIEFRIR